MIGSLALCASAAIGCGGSEEPAETPILVAAGSGAEVRDPALASTVAAREAVWLAYTPLLTYRHASGERGAELIAGLASDLPEVSEDGLTWSLQLRDGLEYSDGRPVRASDFERAIARTLYLESPGASLYESIAGATTYEAAGDPAADISGIEANDENGRISISLALPDPYFADALALPYAAPLPAGTAFRDLSDDPPPGVGPYELGEPDPDGSFVLRRSRGFADLDIPDIPTGNLAEITTKLVPGAARQAQDVLDGKLDYMQDEPPAALEPTIAEQASDRFSEDATAATVYFELDDDRPPFEDPLVREAVNRAVDRARLADEHGAMLPGCALFAPGVPGYDERLDTTECPYGDPTAAPARGGAEALIHQAGAEGQTVGVAASPGHRELIRTYVGELDAIGLEARVVDGSRAQTALHTIAPPFPRAVGFLRALGTDDPLAVAAIDRLATGAELDPDTDELQRIDEYMVSPPQSYLVVLGHPSTTTFLSERIDPKSSILHPLYGTDYSSWQLKEGE